jgi:hypothetical protein
VVGNRSYPVPGVGEPTSVDMFSAAHIERLFALNFRVDMEKATRLMELAILARKRYYAFPAPLVLAVTVGRLLPARRYDWLLTGRGPRQKQKPQTGEQR